LKSEPGLRDATSGAAEQQLYEERGGGFLMTYRLAVDSGGTFTDGVLMNEKGEVITMKAHTTPKDPSIGTMHCITRLASEVGVSLRELLGQTKTIIHGTTLATNIVATRSGAKMGTIATQGYRLRMTFQQVAKSDWGEKTVDLYDMRLEAPKALTSNYLMTEVEERVNCKGEVLVPLNEESVRKAVRYLKEQEVESIAVMLMFSPRGVPGGLCRALFRNASRHRGG
jgi:N-methylhydantoinase A